MEIKWLEDFICLAETRSFSRAAALRHITQPAFSRRIQSLEAWLGSALVDRSTSPTRLTAAGDIFYEQAMALLNQVGEARALVRGQTAITHEMLDFAVPHTLSLTYFPSWLKALEERIGKLPCRLRALNVHDAVMMIAEGGCDVMMCYHHPRQTIQLDALRYDMLVLGTEQIAPFSQPNAMGQPCFALPAQVQPKIQPIPYLSYSPGAFLGQMVDMLLTEHALPAMLNKYYETDMAEALKEMALAGHGLAFLPQSAVRDELATGRLVRADSLEAPLSIDVEIRLYRNQTGAGAACNTSQAKRKRLLVDRIWEALI